MDPEQVWEKQNCLGWRDVQKNVDLLHLREELHAKNYMLTFEEVMQEMPKDVKKTDQQ